MKRIRLIDVDGHNFPSVPLMKISAYHKKLGDDVSWYKLSEDEVDKVYMSKVFTFTKDFEYEVNAKEVIKGGTGYFFPDGGNSLNEDIEHIYPDYGLYGIKNTAYGFLTRGCPRGCKFCIVTQKEGAVSHKVSNLDGFFRGQKEIKLLDPNLLSCKEHIELLQQLADSKAYIDFTQGVDARLLNEKNIEMLKKIKVKNIHFSWDSMKDEKIITDKLKLFKEATNWGYWKMTVYVLVNYDTTLEEDLYRIYLLRDIGYNPYVMIYEKEVLKQGSIYKKLQRYVNNRKIFRSIKAFDEYL